MKIWCIESRIKLSLINTLDRRQGVEIVVEEHGAAHACFMRFEVQMK
jgi:hypothetical protein